MSEIDNRNVLITGGSRGIGVYLAHAFARQGAHIALIARSESGLRYVPSQVSQYQRKVGVFPADLSGEPARAQVAEDIRSEFGPVDILVNNAGLETEGHYLDLEWKEIRRTVEVHFLAPMSLTCHILPEMLGRSRGHIVNIASIGAKSGAPYDAVYGGTKAGISEWTRSLRMEFRETPIRFTTILPGYVRETGMFAKFGLDPPWASGSCTPQKVADAVIRAVRKNRKEKVVNSRPLRWLFVIHDLWPALGDWIMHITGSIDFQRRKVETGVRKFSDR